MKKCISSRPNEIIFLGFVGKTCTKSVIKYHQNPLTFERFMEVFLSMKNQFLEKLERVSGVVFFRCTFYVIKKSEFRNVQEIKVIEKGLKFHNLKSIFTQLPQEKR